MGSKAAVVVVAEGDPRDTFRSMPEIRFSRSKALAERVLGTAVRETEPLPLDLAVWPDSGTVCTASLPGFDVICSRELAQSSPSRLTEMIAKWATGGRAYGVFMDSAEDWSAFAVWSRGDLVRAVSLSPGSGVIEDIGDRLAFEVPFWEGERRVRHTPDYALPFHPIDLGNEALKEFFGFILEGHESADCLDPEEIELPAFRVASQA
ncbi:DUF6928 family protein [Streptomyces sp. NPDC059008]|uniref:DUF6928 family protein n=1 Tax=Streptomyces sp. NPDC059008 TaxID=3346693 RepID=UPI003697A7E7